MVYRRKYDGVAQYRRCSRKSGSYGIEDCVAKAARWPAAVAFASCGGGRDTRSAGGTI